MVFFFFAFYDEECLPNYDTAFTYSLRFAFFAYLKISDISLCRTVGVVRLGDINKDTELLSVFDT